MPTYLDYYAIFKAVLKYWGTELYRLFYSNLLCHRHYSHTVEAMDIHFSSLNQVTAMYVVLKVYFFTAKSWSLGMYKTCKIMFTLYLLPEKLEARKASSVCKKYENLSNDWKEKMIAAWS